MASAFDAARPVTQTKNVTTIGAAFIAAVRDVTDLADLADVAG